MKFTPNIDKNAVLHDTTKKIHVSFDDIEPVVEKKSISKKRSHPAHESDSKESKKAKKSSETKKDKKKKKEKKSKSEKSIKSEEPAEVEKPIVTPVEQKVLIEKPAEQKVEEATIRKVRGPKFTPKKVKTKGKQPPKKLTKEEMQAKVAAIRKKNALKRQAKVKINGEVVAKPAFQLVPAGLTKVMPTKQLGEFVLYALSETTNLPWCSIVHKAKVEHVVMIYAQGLNSTDFGISHTDKVPTMIDLDTLNSEDWIGKAAMPFLTKQARYMITNEISGRNGRFNSPIADILQCNMSNSKKERLAKEQTAKIANFKDNMREFYVLSLEDLRKADYPVPPFLDEASVLPEGWKETHAPIEPTTDNDGRKRIIAVDCEMVLTVKGSALARITLIDEGMLTYKAQIPRWIIQLILFH
jgi:RNA exonuclease 1